MSLIVVAVVLGLWHIVAVLIANTPLQEALHVCGLACITMLRVFMLIALASLVWVPIGVWVGMRPRAAQIVQPIAQFMAAFPANLLFPHRGVRHRRVEAQSRRFLSPLMILGTQWYILFNIIAGATAIPAEMRYVGDEFRRQGMAVVAQGGVAGGAAVLRHRRHHRLGRIVERGHGLRIGELGAYRDAGAGPRFLHRRGGGGRRLSPDRPRG